MDYQIEIRSVVPSGSIIPPTPKYCEIEYISFSNLGLGPKNTADIIFTPDQAIITTRADNLFVAANIVSAIKDDAKNLGLPMLGQEHLATVFADYSLDNLDRQFPDHLYDVFRTPQGEYIINVRYKWHGHPVIKGVRVYKTENVFDVNNHSLIGLSVKRDKLPPGTFNEVDHIGKNVAPEDLAKIINYLNAYPGINSDNTDIPEPIEISSFSDGAVIPYLITKTFPFGAEPLHVKGINLPARIVETVKSQVQTYARSIGCYIRPRVEHPTLIGIEFPKNISDLQNVEKLGSNDKYHICTLIYSTYYISNGKQIPIDVSVEYTAQKNPGHGHLELANKKTITPQSRQYLYSYLKQGVVMGYWSKVQDISQPFEGGSASGK